MNGLNRKLLTWAVSGALLAGSVPALADREADNKPGAGEMATDVLIARPLGAVITVVGAAAFVISLPFSALGGNVGDAADQLVVQPARATFVRCLGCISVND